MKLIAEMALPLLPVEQPGRPSARRRRSRTARSLGAVYYAGELAGPGLAPTGSIPRWPIS